MDGPVVSGLNLKQCVRVGGLRLGVCSCSFGVRRRARCVRRSHIVRFSTVGGADDGGGLDRVSPPGAGVGDAHAPMARRVMVATSRVPARARLPVAVRRMERRGASRRCAVRGRVSSAKASAVATAARAARVPVVHARAGIGGVAGSWMPRDCGSRVGALFEFPPSRSW